MKYVLVIFVTTVVVLAGAYLFFKGPPVIPSYNKNPVSTESANVTTVPTTEPASFTVVKAGGILAFKTYSVNVPNDWQYSTDGSVAGQIDKLTLTHGTYKIVFTQAAMGGGGCVYPGDASQDMSVQFNGFTEVTTSTGEKLRDGVLPVGNRAVCQIKNGGWSDLTDFGHIDITNPTTPDASVLSLIDSILSSLKVIPGIANDNQILIDAVRAGLIAEHGADAGSMNITVSTVEGNFAKGMANAQGGGGIWFAAKVGGTWKLVWDGNGIILCSDITAYPTFPKDLIPSCWDNASSKLITR